MSRLSRFIGHPITQTAGVAGIPMGAGWAAEALAGTLSGNSNIGMLAAAVVGFPLVALAITGVVSGKFFDLQYRRYNELEQLRSETRLRSSQKRGHVNTPRGVV